LHCINKKIKQFKIHELTLTSRWVGACLLRLQSGDGRSEPWTLGDWLTGCLPAAGSNKERAAASTDVLTDLQAAEVPMRKAEAEETCKCDSMLAATTLG